MTTTAVQSQVYDKGGDHETQVRHGKAALVAVLLAGVATFLPSIGSPFVLDDYLHASMVKGTFPSPRSPFDLYNFVSDADRAILFQRGILPWWSHPRLTIRFLRPLSSALLWIDHRLFGGHPLLLHLQSLAWWVAAVLAARALYTRGLSSRSSLFATVIFALGAWHAIPLAWLANSEALVSLALGTFALGAYVRWRSSARAKDFAVSAVLFALAMLGGEYALCFGGYVLAFEIVHRRGGHRRALRGILPFALPAAGYLTARVALGYGSFGSGFYSDPLLDPVAFARTAPWRFVALLSDGWLTIPSDGWGSANGRWVGAAVVAVAILLLVQPLRRAHAGLSGEARSTAAWMLIGSVVSMAPVMSVVPSARVMGVSALGIAANIAILLDHAWFPPEGASMPSRPAWAAELTGLVALLFGFAHLVHGPVTAWLVGSQMRRSALEFISHTAWLRDRLSDPASADVIVIRAGGGMFFGPFAVDPSGRPPARWRTLSHTGHALVLRRDARTLDVITPADKSVFPAGFGNLFRSPGAPLRTGNVVVVPGMRARILEAGDHGPTKVRYEFDRELESPSLIWTAEDSYGFRKVELPKVGFGAPFDP